ncbi:MAG: long-chain fatty acid--CoA ligase [Spirochaetota bacterium]
MRVKNLALMIHEQITKYGAGKKALYYKEGEDWLGISWKDFGARIDQAAMGLLELGVKEKELVAVYSGNRPEWVIADYAIMSAKGSTVAIYATNTADQAEFIVNDAGIKVIFVDDQFQYDNVMKFFKGNKTLKKVIVFSKSVKIDKDKDIMYIDDLYALGKKSGKEKELQKRLDSASEDDISTIIYTSGTTGDPKGAMLAHKSFFVEMNALDLGFPMGENDIELVFLPLSHVYGKASMYWIHSKGATEYFCYDTNKIVEYFQEVKPTYMVGVPRLYEKMYAAIFAKLETASPLKKKLFMWGVKTGKEYRFITIEGKSPSIGLRIKHAIAYKLVLSKIRDLLGGRLNFFSAGGAPLAKEIEEFFFSANIFIAQGYGLTETAPCGSFNTPANFKFGTVGRPIPGNDIKIAEDGEILIKGDNVMKGYYNKPETDKEVFTKDGYFKTGDIGIIDKDGYLVITDRKKDIIITAGGKNVAPQNIESRIGKDFYIEQIVVIGEKQKYITALIVPSFDALQEYAKQNKIEFSSKEDLIKNPAIIEFYKQRIETQSEGLAQFEKIQKFELLPEEFSIEKGEITPTMKIKRKVINTNFKDTIKKMY